MKTNNESSQIYSIVLDIIMRHYTDSEFNYSEPAVRNVKVWQVPIEQMTGKVFGLRANEKP